MKIEDIKQSTLQEIIDSENKFLNDANNMYGDFFDNTLESINLLNNFIKSFDDLEKYIFVIFLSQVKKNIVLSVFSAIRCHHVQSGMNLRQVLESACRCIYAMENKEKEKFLLTDNRGIMSVPDKLKKKMYKWVEENFKDSSDKIYFFKNAINETVSHSNIIYSLQNFKAKKDLSEFNNFFFDHFDEYKVKVDLWSIANISISLLEIFYEINKKSQIFTLIDDFDGKLKKISNDNTSLRQQLMEDIRFKNIKKGID